ncbi:hypothetical protein [Oceanicoccus sp. KOV_DT_Chl]|uniref:hypothetical protein n=1 Tax=Oceanicoccus sp. KOV_DT_Chl TaxID=1904639 RepID=UPI000C7BBA43|nr:hypothetical protein [Oceanicoccus sp. KOV_DT_Chl]
METPIDIDQLALLIITEQQDEKEKSTDTDIDMAEEFIYLTQITTMERGTQGKLLITAKIISKTVTNAHYYNENNEEQHCLMAVNDQQHILIADSKKILNSQQIIVTQFNDGLSGECQLKGLHGLTQQAQILEY